MHRCVVAERDQVSHSDAYARSEGSSPQTTPPLPRGFYFPEGHTLPTELLMQYHRSLWEHSRAIGSPIGSAAWVSKGW